MSAPKTPRLKQPVSARQLAANRANAARSTGPRTPEGKARSSQNSRRHGFAAGDFAVVSLEDLQAVANLKEDLVSVHQPVNSQELFAIERMALAQQALLRAARPGRPWAAGLFTCCLDDAVDSRGEGFIPMAEALSGDLEVTPGQDHNFALALGFSRMVQRGNTWGLFLRYQAQAERLYRRAVEKFERLKAQRHDLPNEAIFEGQPDENPTPSAPPETNPIGPADEPLPPPAPVIERPNPVGFEALDACHSAQVRLGSPQPDQPVEVKPKPSIREVAPETESRNPELRRARAAYTNSSESAGPSQSHRTAGSNVSRMRARSRSLISFRSAECPAPDARFVSSNGSALRSKSA